MASLEKRNGVYRLVFRHQGRKHSLTLGRLPPSEALHLKGTVEYLLNHLRLGILDTKGCDVVTFVRRLGRPAADTNSLGRLADEYLSAAARSLEATTHRVRVAHFRCLLRVLGRDTLVAGVARGDLQRYADRRQAEGKSAVTIRNELRTLRTAWNWWRREGLVASEWPGQRLSFPRGHELLPFLTLDEAGRHFRMGDPAGNGIFRRVYLRSAEVADLLDGVKARAARGEWPPWLWPMFVMAAHTGARRSEMVRVRPYDVDLKGGILLLREKKRDVTKYTFRSVPLTPLLRGVLQSQLAAGCAGGSLLHDGGRPVDVERAKYWFHVALAGTRWEVLRGWHVFRHSFISALVAEGVDQRIIDDLVGHSTEEQRRRYRHLVPEVRASAVLAAFGEAGQAPVAEGNHHEQP